MTNVAGTVLDIPRRCGRQTRRNNVLRDTPEDYWRCAVFVAFLDELLQQLDVRFTVLTAKALTGLKLLPSNIEKLAEEDVVQLKEWYGPDLPSRPSLSAEINLWRTRWQYSENKPQNLWSTITETPQKMYPNVHRILYLLLFIPLVSAGVE